MVHYFPCPEYCRKRLTDGTNTLDTPHKNLSIDLTESRIISTHVVSTVIYWEQQNAVILGNVNTNRTYDNSSITPFELQ